MITTPPPTQTGTMRAIVQREYGDASVLHIDEIARPGTPGKGRVLIQVHAAGLDRGVWHLMMGTPRIVRYAGFGVRRPKNPVPGLDLAGVVIAVGEGVDRFSPGDHVLGAGTGTYAEFAVAKANKLVHRPNTLDARAAATVTISGLTALQAVCDKGRVRAGQQVLIIGASGGVGSFAVQIAKAIGATVTGVCSAAKADFVRRLGADHVIEYTSRDTGSSITGDGQRFDVIIDIAGGRSLSTLRRALTPRGTLVIVGSEGGGAWFNGLDRQLRAVLLSPFVRQRLTTFTSVVSSRNIERLLQMITDGHVTPAVERCYPLAETAEAMRHLADGQARGKLVIVVDEG